MTRILYIDYETQSAADLPAIGSWLYSKDPSTRVIQLAYRFSDWESGRVDIINQFDRSKPFPLPKECKEHTGPVVAHNYAFERAISQNVLDWHIEMKQWRCTMATARRNGIPGKLSEASSFLSLENGKKAELGEYLIKKYSLPKKDGTFNTMDINDEKAWTDYGIFDVLACEEIYETLPKLHLDKIEGFAWEDFKVMEAKGLLLDRNVIQRILNAYEATIDKAKIRAEILCGLTTSGGLVIMSPSALKTWFADKGIVRKSLDKTNLDKIEVETEDIDILEVIALRRLLGSKPASKLNTMLNTSSDEGETIGALIYYGTITGRPAGRLWQPLNMPRIAAADAQYDNALNDLENSTDIAGFEKKVNLLIRGTLIPPKDEKIIVADYNAIEARIVAWLSECSWAMERYIAGRDIYLDMAMAIYDKPLTAENDIERQVGKIAILSAGYGAGWEKFGGMLEAQTKLKFDPAMLKKIIDTYRENCIDVKNFWRACDMAFKEALTGKISFAGRLRFEPRPGMIAMYLPSGRYLLYHRPKLGYNEEGKLELSVQYGNGRERIWGSVIFENACQAIASDLTNNAVHLAMIEDKIDVRMTVYDEIIGYSKGDPIESLDSLTRCMLTKPAWLEEMPLKVAGKILNRYGK